MDIVTSLALGLLAGWIASALTGLEKRIGLFTSLFVGSVGGAVGGWVFRLFGGEGVSGFNLYSLTVSVVGAVICLWVMKSILGAREPGAE